MRRFQNLNVKDSELSFADSENIDGNVGIPKHKKQRSISYYLDEVTPQKQEKYQKWFGRMQAYVCVRFKSLKHIVRL